MALAMAPAYPAMLRARAPRMAAHMERPQACPAWEEGGPPAFPACAGVAGSSRQRSRRHSPPAFGVGIPHRACPASAVGSQESPASEGRRAGPQALSPVAKALAWRCRSRSRHSLKWLGHCCRVSGGLGHALR